MVIIPVTGLRARRSHPERTTVSAAAVETPSTVAIADERLAPDRASRSAGWARRALDEMPLEDFTTTTEAPVVTTAAPVRRATVTTAKPKPVTTTAKPKPATTTTTAAPKATAPRDAAPPTTTEPNGQSGKASWYEAAPAGTCAHRTLPMGTIVTVTATSSGKSVTCRVADRGPYVNGWIIDLSKETFSALAPLDAGVISVRLSW
jgi:rare lipoprotein A